MVYFFFLKQKVNDVKLPEQIYLGFTAHTGEVTGMYI